MGEVVGLKGLQNVEKNSYMNAVIQCLGHSQDFSNYFLHNHYLKRTYYDVSISSALREIFNKIWEFDEAAIGHTTVINTNDLTKAIRKAKGKEYFRDVSAQNPHDFLTCLLSELNEELKTHDFDKNEDLNTPIETKLKSLRAELGHSVIYEIFCSIQKIEKKQNHVLYDTIYRGYVTYTIQPCSSATDVEAHILDHMSGYACRRCCTNDRTNSEFSKFPKVLVIDLTRCENVIFTKQLDLCRLVRQDPIYELFAIVYVRRRHAWACCKHFIDNTWYKFDDEKVRQVECFNQQGVPRNAKLLFYRKQVPGLRALSNNVGICFINAVVQCLSHTKGFSSYFRNKEYQTSVHRNYKLSNALSDIFNEIWHKYKLSTTSTLQLHEITELPVDTGLNTKKFFVYLSTQLHRELLFEALPLMPYEYRRTGQANRTGYSKIWETFCSVVSEIRLNATSNRYELIYKESLCFDLPRCEYGYTDVETNFVTHMFGPGCLCISEKIVPFEVSAFAKVLVFNLMGNFESTDTYFSFTEKLNLSKFTYNLYAVIYYHKITGIGNHVFAFCKHKENNQWYYFNDSEVRTAATYTTDWKPLNPTPGDIYAAYMLFYIKE